ncbi:MAG: patatin-like phospholipase family protein [Gammaproteobacteria bacterium]
MEIPLYRNLIFIVLLALSLQLLSACASYGTISNRPVADVGPAARYSVNHAVHSSRSDEVTMVLAFSGGGIRAAALAYGVLEAMRDTSVSLDGQSRRLLDEIDAISSVSGGSFTSAYFGLHGDGIFSDYEDNFLHSDVTGELVHGLLDPALWFSTGGRTEMAIDYYDEKVFKGATFADLQRRAGPLIVINATDLGRGIRFSFLQDYFDLLCSDLSSFQLARAVAASSAVPVLFHPVVLKNHAGCNTHAPTVLQKGKPLANRSPQLARVVDGLNSYALKDQRQYIHLVDGGITDNLGLLAVYEMVEVAGGAKNFLDSMGSMPAPRFIVISVNASTSPIYDIESTNENPSVEDTINLVTDVQIHRSNVATLELLHNSVKRWSAELATPEKPVESYFVEIDFNRIPQSGQRQYFNQIPTSLSLSQEQVDDLIAVGRELLLSNNEFQRFVRDMGGNRQ